MGPRLLGPRVSVAPFAVFVAVCTVCATFAAACASFIADCVPLGALFLLLFVLLFFLFCVLLLSAVSSAAAFFWVADRKKKPPLPLLTFHNVKNNFCFPKNIFYPKKRLLHPKQRLLCHEKSASAASRARAPANCHDNHCATVPRHKLVSVDVCCSWAGEVLGGEGTPAWSRPQRAVHFKCPFVLCADRHVHVPELIVAPASLQTRARDSSTPTALARGKQPSACPTYIKGLRHSQKASHMGSGRRNRSRTTVQNKWSSTLNSGPVGAQLMPPWSVHETASTRVSDRCTVCLRRDGRGAQRINRTASKDIAIVDTICSTEPAAPCFGGKGVGSGSSRANAENLLDEPTGAVFDTKIVPHTSFTFWVCPRRGQVNYCSKCQ